jgi:hypothetical protein
MSLLVGEATKDVGEEGFETVTAMMMSGRFTLLGVPAGEHMLKSGNRFRSVVQSAGRQAAHIDPAQETRRPTSRCGLGCIEGS